MIPHIRSFGGSATLTKRVIPASFILMGLPGTSGMSQTQPTEKEPLPINLSPFVVTTDSKVGYSSQLTTAGTRTVQKLIDIAGSVSVVNEQFIDDLAAVNVQEILNYGTSGVTQNQTVEDDMTIRGFRMNGIFRDGIQKGVHKNNPLYDVSQVEVVKGPVAMTFNNSGVLGGAVNFVSRKPTADHRASIKTTLGENNYLRVSANSSGPLMTQNNMKLLYRATVGYQNDDRWKEIESDDEEFYGGALSFEAGNTLIHIDGYYFRDTGYTYWHDFLDITNTDRAVLNQHSTVEFSPARAKDNQHDVSERYFHVDMTSNLTPDLSIRTTYTRSNAEEARRTIRGINVLADNFTLTRQEIDIFLDGTQHTLQTDLLYRLELGPTTHDLSAGVEFRESWDKRLQSRGTPPNINTRDPDFSKDNFVPYSEIPWGFQNLETSSESLSYYVQDFMSLWKERVLLVGGLRWISSEQVRTNKHTDETSQETNPTELVHRYGVVFKPINNVSLYYADAKTFQLRSGVLGDSGIPLKNSEGTLNEFGIKGDLFEGRLFGVASYFDMELTNVPTLAVNPDGSPTTIQTEGDTVKGFEFEVGYRHLFSDVGRLDAIVTYYDVESKTATGERPNNAVDKSYSLLGKYNFLAGPLEGLGIGASYLFTGDRVARASKLIDSHNLINFFVTYRINVNWQAQLNVNNVTDERYIVSFAADGLVQTPNPRTARLTVSYNW